MERAAQSGQNVELECNVNCAIIAGQVYRQRSLVRGLRHDGSSLDQIISIRAQISSISQEISLPCQVFSFPNQSWSEPGQVKLALRQEIWQDITQQCNTPFLGILPTFVFLLLLSVQMTTTSNSMFILCGLNRTSPSWLGLWSEDLLHIPTMPRLVALQRETSRRKW